MCNCLLELLRSSADEEPIVDDQTPDRETVQVLIISSREGVLATIHNLHRRGFAEVNDWSPLLPAYQPGKLMSILMRDRVIERSATP